MSVSTSTRAVAVMIVDDHEGYRAIAAEVVAAAPGFTLAAQASDRREALQGLSRGGIDLVLMDVNLGGEDGLELTAELVELARERAYPIDVVLVSALGRQDLPAAAQTCGARGHLPKVELSPRALGAMTAGVYDWRDGNATGRAGR